MGLAEIKARAKVVLDGVAGMGMVYTRTLNLTELQAQSSLAVKDGRLNLWMISREGASLQDEDVNQAMQTQTDAILVHGFLAVKSSEGADSEADFDALVTAALRALNLDRQPAPQGTSFGGTIANAAPPQLRNQDYRMFGPSQVLCHHCEITMRADSDVQ